MSIARANSRAYAVLMRHKAKVRRLPAVTKRRTRDDLVPDSPDVIKHVRQVFILCKAAGLTEEVMAAALGVKRRTLGRWFKEKPKCCPLGGYYALAELYHEQTGEVLPELPVPRQPSSILREAVSDYTAVPKDLKSQVFQLARALADYCGQPKPSDAEKLRKLRWFTELAEGFNEGAGRK